MRGVIQHKNYEIEYFVFGNGKRTLIAFHGFNNNAADFSTLGEIMGEEYSVLAVNIFFHGTSIASEELVEKGFSVPDLRELFDVLAAILPSEKYSLLGYSLGGRLVLKLFEIYPRKIDKLILLAPDGIKISPFYRFMTHTSIGQKLLKRVIDHGNIFLMTARFSRTFKLVSEKKYLFAMHNFDTIPKRKMVYNVWMVLRNVLSKNDDIKALLTSNTVKLHLFFGRFDSIIPPAIAINFRKGSEDLITLNILDSGHRMLKEKTLREMAVRLKEMH